MCLMQVRQKCIRLHITEREHYSVVYTLCAGVAHGRTRRTQGRQKKKENLFDPHIPWHKKEEKKNKGDGFSIEKHTTSKQRGKCLVGWLGCEGGREGDHTRSCKERRVSTETGKRWGLLVLPAGPRNRLIHRTHRGGGGMFHGEILGEIRSFQ